jgi:gamma-glutamyltranspeptidase/glutathione hydrolase
LLSHRSTFPTPISTTYRGVEVFEVPPNGQGITALLALNILEGLPVLPHDSVDRLHAQIESIRLAFADTRWYVADPDVVHVPVDELLSKEYAATRRALISMHAAAVVDKVGLSSRDDFPVHRR